jgi:hypothetical protein
VKIVFFLVVTPLDPYADTKSTEKHTDTVHEISGSLGAGFEDSSAM